MTDSLLSRLHRMCDEDPYGEDAVRLLRSLLVFTTPFRREAMAAVAPNDIDRFRRLSVFATLRIRKFVIPLPDNCYAVAEGVAEVLTPLEGTHQRVFQYYAGCCALINACWSYRHIPFIAREWDHIYNALLWGLEHEPKAALKMASDLAGYLHYDRAQWPTLMQCLLRASQLMDLRTQIQTLRLIARMADFQKNHVTAHEAYRQAIILQTSLRDEELLFNLLVELASLALGVQDYDTAIETVKRALRLNRPHAEFHLLARLLYIANQQRDYGLALEYLDRMIALPRFIQLRELVELFCAAAETAQKTGDITAASGYYARAVLASDQEWTVNHYVRVLWMWGQMIYHAGDQYGGCRLCQLALYRTNLDPTLFRNQGYEYITEIRQTYAAMTCGDD